jgi:hypothetical protein
LEHISGEVRLKLSNNETQYKAVFVLSSYRSPDGKSKDSSLFGISDTGKLATEKPDTFNNNIGDDFQSLSLRSSFMENSLVNILRALHQSSSTLLCPLA